MIYPALFATIRGPIARVVAFTQLSFAASTICIVVLLALICAGTIFVSNASFAFIPAPVIRLAFETHSL